MKSRDPPSSLHPPIHPSIPPCHTFLPVPKREREREGERSSRKSFVHEHYSMTWIVVLLCEQLECLLCALMPDSHSKDPRGCGQRLPQQHHETRQQPEHSVSGATRKTVRHGERQRTPVHSYPYFLDARGCTQDSLGLKVPTQYLFL